MPKKTRRSSGVSMAAPVKILEHPRSDQAAVESPSFLGQDAALMATEYRSFQEWLLRAAD
jgi:hypothetical protein